MRPMPITITLTALLLSLGCGPAVVRRPVVVTPPPCLSELAPAPPAETAPDADWTAYHVALEVWAAQVERECGAHLMPAAGN